LGVWITVDDPTWIGAAVDGDELAGMSYDLVLEHWLGIAGVKGSVVRQWLDLASALCAR
jgi:hypothetical protein